MVSHSIRMGVFADFTSTTAPGGRKSPVAPKPWTSYDATRYRDICVQTNPKVWELLSPGESEDCLYLVGSVPGPWLLSNCHYCAPYLSSESEHLRPRRQPHASTRRISCESYLWHFYPVAPPHVGNLCLPFPQIMLW